MAQPDLFSNHKESFNIISQTEGVIKEHSMEDPPDCETEDTELFVNMRSHHPIEIISNMYRPEQDERNLNSGPKSVNSPKQKFDWKSHRMYVVVIVLLYVGLVTSFSLNISLMVEQKAAQPVHEVNHQEQEFTEVVSSSSACLVQGGYKKY